MAMSVAKACGGATMSLPGANGGHMADAADIAIKASDGARKKYRRLTLQFTMRCVY